MPGESGHRHQPAESDPFSEPPQEQRWRIRSLTHSPGGAKAHCRTSGISLPRARAVHQKSAKKFKRLAVKGEFGREGCPLLGIPCRLLSAGLSNFITP